MKKVVTISNAIRNNALTHRRFRDLMHEIESVYDDIPYFIEVRWLSGGKVLRRVWELIGESMQFLRDRESFSNWLSGPIFLNDLEFLTDICEKLTDLSIRLQGHNNMGHQLYSVIVTFERKLDLWKTQVANQNFVNFPRLSKQLVNEAFKERYTSKLSSLQEQFGKTFKDLRQHEGKQIVFPPSSCQLAVDSGKISK